MFIYYGDGASTVAPSTTTVSLGSRLLKKGMTGADVKTLQELLQLGYSLPKYGADGDFGSETEAAVIAFQKAEGLEQDGKYGEKTHAALMDAIADDDAGKAGSDEATLPASRATVVIEADGGNVNVRVGNGTQYSHITTIRSGTTLEHVATAPNGWNAIIVGSQIGWVSGKYSRVIE